MSQQKLLKKGYGTEIQCLNSECNHVWEYRGNMLYGCCPSCRRNVRIKEGRARFLEANTGTTETENKTVERRSESD